MSSYSYSYLQDLKVAEMIPYDLIVKILSLLPVKSLVRFRCVSKLWYSLTHDPYFQEEQRKIASTRRKYIICTYYFGNKMAMLQSLRHEKKKMNEIMMYGIHASEKIEDCSFKFYFPDEDTYYPKPYTLSNSVDGLICALCEGKRSDCYLMNLSTREIEKLPEHSIKIILYNNLPTCVTTKFLGLGFDASTGDYKVIRLLIFMSSITNYSYHYMILTVGSNQDWRYVGEISCEIICPTSLVFINGKLHWLASNKRLFTKEGFMEEDQGLLAIFTIDMKDETYGTVATPVPFSVSSIHGGTDDQVKIQEDEEGHLVLLQISQDEMRIWTMMDYTTHKWTNTYTIDSYSFLQPKLLLFGLAYNKVLLYAESKFGGMAVCSYDLQTKTFQEHCRGGVHSNMRSYFYSESLLSPKNLLCKDNISSSSNNNSTEWPVFDN